MMMNREHDAIKFLIALKLLITVIFYVSALVIGTVNL